MCPAFLKIGPKMSKQLFKLIKFNSKSFVYKTKSPFVYTKLRIFKKILNASKVYKNAFKLNAVFLCVCFI